MAAVDGFVFYASFAEALEDLPAEDFKECITILSNYALKGEEPEQMSPFAKIFFKMAKPQIDANTKRRNDGTQGGRPKKTSGFEDGESQKPVVSELKTSGFEETENQKPVVSELETSGFEVSENRKPKEKDKEKDKVKEKEKEKAKEKDKGGSPYPLSARTGLVEDIEPEQIAELGVDIYVAESLSEWIRSRSAKHAPISEADFKAVISQLKDKIQKHGATAVRNQIQESMADGYKGLCLDKLDKRSRADPADPNGFGKVNDAAKAFLARGGG